MKNLFIVLLLMYPLLLHGQTRNETTRSIDSLVNYCIYLDTTSPIQSLISNNNDNSTEITLHLYGLCHEKVSLLKVNYKKDSTNYEYHYFLNDGKLIYAEEDETTNVNGFKNEEAHWIGKFYFLDKKLIYYETTGHGKSETDDWQPEKEIQEKFNLRMLELNKKH